MEYKDASSSPPTPGPGWYPVPGSDTFRYWNGFQWVNPLVVDPTSGAEMGPEDRVLKIDKRSGIRRLLGSNVKLVSTVIIAVIAIAAVVTTVVVLKDGKPGFDDEQLPRALSCESVGSGMASENGDSPPFVIRSAKLTENSTDSIAIELELSHEPKMGRPDSGPYLNQPETSYWIIIAKDSADPTWGRGRELYYQINALVQQKTMSITDGDQSNLPIGSSEIVIDGTLLTLRMDPQALPDLQPGKRFGISLKTWHREPSGDNFDEKICTG